MRETHRLREAATVTVDTSGVSSAQVAGDPNELTRAIRNLLDNATRHAISTVTVTLAERGENAVLTVADDGPGIATPLHERIFERFVRVDEARTSGDGGTGLGLRDHTRDRPTQRRRDSRRRRPRSWRAVRRRATARNEAGR